MDGTLYAELTQGMAVDTRLSVVMAAIEALLSRDNLAEARRYLEFIANDLVELPDRQSACVFYTRAGGLFFHGARDLSDRCYGAAEAQLRLLAVAEFIPFYLGFYRFTDGRLAFLHHTYLARLLHRSGHAEASNDLLEKMYALYKQNIPMEIDARPFLRAAIVGEYVSAEIVEERAITCRACEHLKDYRGVPICGLNGVKVNGRGFRPTDLTSYQENLPAWGCPHPQRASGHGWKR